MNKNTKPKIDVEKGTADFLVNMTGDVNNHTYLGRFEIKCVLSPLDQINADREYRDFLGNNMILASEQVKNHAFALAQCKYRIIESPPFWQTAGTHGNLEDDNVITAVLNACIDAQESYLELRKKEQVDIEKSLTKRMKENLIEKEPDVESIDEKVSKKDEEVEMD